MMCKDVSIVAAVSSVASTLDLWIQEMLDFRKGAKTWGLIAKTKVFGLP